MTLTRKAFLRGIGGLAAAGGVGWIVPARPVEAAQKAGKKLQPVAI